MYIEKVLMIVTAILLLCSIALAYDVINMQDCTAYFPANGMYIDNEWHYLWEELPVSERQPEYVVIGNVYHVIKYQGVTNDR